MDVERARAFVLAHGGVREAARLAGILTGERVEREVARSLEALQNPDGGFPARQEPGAPSAIDTTCYLLGQLADLPPLGGSPMADRALAFLRRSQGRDGAWQETSAADALVGPWAPGARTYLTAGAAFTLAVMAPGHRDPIERAVGWLRGAVGDDGGGIYPQTLAMVTALLWWQNPEDPLIEAVYGRLRAGRPDAGLLAWWLSGALRVGMGGRFVVPLAEDLAALAALQQPDGSWPAADGGFPVETTLQSLRVLRGYQLI